MSGRARGSGDADGGDAWWSDGKGGRGAGPGKAAGGKAAGGKTSAGRSAPGKAPAGKAGAGKAGQGKSAAQPARTPGPAPLRAHKVRIIGGRWKRTPLPVPDLDGLRPSPDRVRETLFNWIGPSITGQRVLDLFAGSGALGLESLSRGAAGALLVERDRQACAGIRSVIGKLQAAQAQLVEGDALAALDGCARRGERFTLVFLDPPFRQDWLARVLPGLARVLAPRARLYVESERAVSADEIAQGLKAGGLAGGAVELARADRAGQVHYHLFDIEARPAAAPAPDAVPRDASGAAAASDPASDPSGPSTP